MIQFIENQSYGYATRTYANVQNSDITIAFAKNFGTAGEQTTKAACTHYGKLYLPIAINSSFKIISAKSVQSSLRLMFKGEPFSVNIAGNGLYTFADTKGISQQVFDDYLEEFLGYAFESLPVSSICSGGQTGIDEAGLKYGDNHGYETICRFPHTWMFRDITGTDICDKFQFLKRFYVL